MLIRFILRNQGHRDAVMHEFHSNVNKVHKAIAKVTTIGDRLPLIMLYFGNISWLKNIQALYLQSNIHYSGKQNFLV